MRPDETVQQILAPFEPDRMLSNRVATQGLDLRHARRHIQRIFGDHDLSVARRGHDVSLTHRTASLGALSFNTIEYGADVEINVDWTDRPLFILVLPFVGSAEIRHAGRTSQCRPGAFFVLDPREPFRLAMDADHRNLSIGIPPDALRRALRTSGFGQGDPVVHFSHQALPLTERNAALFDFIAFLCRDLNRPRSVATAPAVTQALEDSFLRLLLAATLGEMDADVVPRAVRVAQGFMLERLKDEVSIPDVARAAGVSVRTLSQQFSLYRNTSPSRWLRRQRLVRAREDLAGRGSACATVTEAALRYGFSNVGRFASAYVEEFGEYPSDTLAHQG